MTFDKDNKFLSALIISDRDYLSVVDLLDLLYRAGYKVDVISASKAVKYLFKKINYLIIEKNKKKLIYLASAMNDINNYSLIIPSTDQILQAILDSDLNIHKKLALLPITGVQHMSHLYSKIELSKIFQKDNIPTPDFKIAQDECALRMIHHEHSKPYIIKIDSSAGGIGVYEIYNENDLNSFFEKKNQYPILIQEKIVGRELDISGYFKNEKLCYFYLAEPLKNLYDRGPSVIRRYLSRKNYTKEIIDELNQIGKALGINGFTNISCFELSKNKRVYFEVDLRPNGWVNHGQFFGHDLASCLKTNQLSLRPDLLEDKVLTHYMRVSLIDLIFNKHDVTNQIPVGAWKIICYKNFKKLMKTFRNKFFRA